MFDFEKLIAYKKARETYQVIQNKIPFYKLTPIIRDQLQRALVSMVINIAEGTGKLSPNDRKNFYVIARGSTYECASLLDLIQDTSIVSIEQISYLKNSLEQVSRLLSVLIKELLLRK
ncbi:MAG: four helix bundle protein [Candidatus Gracilibacteria bacterium]